MSHNDDQADRSSLRRLLIDRYEELRQRLMRRLGSVDAAQETLHELYLRLDGPGSAGALKNPTSYLLASAVNLARDHWRTEHRRAQRADVDALYKLIDENPGPDRIAEARLALESLKRALDQLTPRQRAIIIAVRFEHLTQPEIAKRLNISSRLVRLELQRALEHCQAHRAKDF